MRVTRWSNVGYSLRWFRTRLDAGLSRANRRTRSVSNGGRVSYAFASERKLRLKITSTESSPPSSIAAFTAFSAALL